MFVNRENEKLRLTLHNPKAYGRTGPVEFSPGTLRIFATDDGRNRHQQQFSTIERQLDKKRTQLPFIRNKKVIKVIFVTTKPPNPSNSALIFDAGDICGTG